MLSETYEEFKITGTKSDDALMNGNYYPKELLDEAEHLLDKGIKAVEESQKDVEPYTARLNCVMLTPMRMRLYNYYMYNRDKHSIFEYFEKFAFGHVFGTNVDRHHGYQQQQSHNSQRYADRD